MVAFALHLNVYRMGKAQIFRPPFCSLMMWLGGLGEIVVPTGDGDAGIAAIKAFYAPFKGKNAAQYHAD
jgi:hypothetical protein